MTGLRTTSVIALSAAALGIAGDYLIRAPEWGVNFSLGALLIAVAGMTVVSRSGREATRWPWLASIFFASMWSVRGSEPLLAVDLLAAVALATLPLLQATGVAARAAGLLDLGLLPFRTALTALVGAFGLVQAARAERPPAEVPRSRARALGVGALLAVPLLLVFGALFTSADPVFDRTITTVLGQNIGLVLAHVVTASVLAWAAAGYLWFLTKPSTSAKLAPTFPVLGGLQVLTPVAAVVLLFGLFLGVQVTSLFGGAAFVETTTGLTYAAYARQGFFQLVVASMLVLPLVYFAPQAAGTLDETATRRLRSLLALQLVLTALVLASALWRLLLYVRAYGLTEDRVNGVAVMTWIAGTLAVFAVTVVRGRPRTAVFGSVVTAMVTLAALNLVNPQAFIARYDLSHQTGREIDFEHLARLGGDAVPILVSRIDSVPEAARCRVIGLLRSRNAAYPTDWRAWNRARVRAREAVAALTLPANCPAEAPRGTGD